MLKKYIPLILVVFFTQTLFSQINYGIKFGMNYSEVNVDNNFTSIEVGNYNSFKFGFHIGAVVRISISNKISVNAELLYSDKGSSNNKGNDTEYYEFNLYYLNFPLTLNYMVVKDLYIQLGIEPGFLSSSNFDDYYTEDILQYNSFDLGALVGAEYFIRKIGIGMRYGRSVIPIFDKTHTLNEETIGRTKAYNSNFQIYFTYLFKTP